MTRLQYVKRNVAGFYRRNAAVIPLTIIALCVMGVFVLQALTIGQLQDTVAKQNKLIATTSDVSQQILKASKQRTDQINDVNRHLDCIVQFFAQPDRGNKAIDNIETCRIDDLAPSTSSAPSPSGTAPAAPSAPAQTAPQGAAPATPPAKPQHRAPAPSQSQGVLQQLLGLVGL